MAGKSVLDFEVQDITLTAEGCVLNKLPDKVLVKKALLNSKMFQLKLKEMIDASCIMR